MFFSGSYFILLYVASLRLNNYFSAAGKGCVQILHKLHRYEMLFSMAQSPQVFNLP